MASVCKTMAGMWRSFSSPGVEFLTKKNDSFSPTRLEKYCFTRTRTKPQRYIRTAVCTYSSPWQGQAMTRKPDASLCLPGKGHFEGIPYPQRGIYSPEARQQFRANNNGNCMEHWRKKSFTDKYLQLNTLNGTYMLIRMYHRSTAKS